MTDVIEIVHIHGEEVEVTVPTVLQTDLVVLTKDFVSDPALVAGSLVVDPANGSPGQPVAISVDARNAGDVPLTNIDVVYAPPPAVV